MTVLHAIDIQEKNISKPIYCQVIEEAKRMRLDNLINGSEPTQRHPEKGTDHDGWLNISPSHGKFNLFINNDEILLHAPSGQAEKFDEWIIHITKRIPTVNGFTLERDIDLLKTKPSYSYRGERFYRWRLSNSEMTDRGRFASLLAQLIFVLMGMKQ